MKHARPLLLLTVALASVWRTSAQEASIRVYSDQPLFELSRHMTGACIEDVNHEIYGGIYSQMIFGENSKSLPRRLPWKA